ncbi:MAG: sigma-70 family RNA polymerase sigma factor, partial [Sphingobacteriaceae bacterium]
YYRKQIIRNSFKSSLFHDDYDNSSEQSILLKDLQQHIDNLIDQLPAKCKSVYQLSRIENRSNKEIATLLNISEKTVEGHLTKALKQLRISLSEFLILMVLLLIK